jgi:hypothetical protein
MNEGIDNGDGSELLTIERVCDFVYGVQVVANEEGCNFIETPQRGLQNRVFPLKTVATCDPASRMSDTT